MPIDRRLLPPSEPIDPVPSWVDPAWYRMATRDEARAIVDRAMRHDNRRRKLVVAGRHVGAVADHMLAVGFCFLRRISGIGGAGGSAIAPREPSDCSDLADYREPTMLQLADVAAYAIEVIGGADRDAAWSAGFHFADRAHVGDPILWRAGTRPKGAWRISEVWAAEQAAAEAERRRWPSWDD